MLLAADSGGTDLANPLTWINFGVLGLLVVGAITGVIYFKPTVERVTEERDRLITEKDRLTEQRDAMAQVLQDRLLPVVGDFITTTRALLPILQEIQQLQQLLPLLHELERLLDELMRQRGETRERPEPRSPRRRG